MMKFEVNPAFAKASVGRLAGVVDSEDAPLGVGGVRLAEVFSHSECRRNTNKRATLRRA